MSLVCLQLFQKTNAYRMEGEKKKNSSYLGQLNLLAVSGCSSSLQDMLLVLAVPNTSTSILAIAPVPEMYLKNSLLNKPPCSPETVYEGCPGPPSSLFAPQLTAASCLLELFLCLCCPGAHCSLV